MSLNERVCFQRELSLEGRKLDHGGMIVTLQTQGLQTQEQVRAFVEGNAAAFFTLTDRASAHAWMSETLRRFGYKTATRAERGVLRQYLAKVSGLSRAQVMRCMRQFTAVGDIQDRRCAPAVPFVRHYTDEDIRLLAEVDALHGTRSGTTTRKLCERAFAVHGDARFERLAEISNGHLYNLRRHATYRAKRGSFDKTRPTKVNIGERRRPFPNGSPGSPRKANSSTLLSTSTIFFQLAPVWPMLASGSA